jgi:hypothetical protein
MMDIVPPVEITTPAQEVLRDRRGTIIGRIEHQRLTAKFVLRDHRGVVLGTFDPRSNETRDKSGRVIGRGNLLGALLVLDGR